MISDIVDVQNVHENANTNFKKAMKLKEVRSESIEYPFLLI